MASELQQRYQKTIAPALLKSLGLKNQMQLPRIEKVVVNVGMGSYLQRLGTKDYGTVEDTLTKITGQKPTVRKSRMSVSNFKLREGMPVGMTVTLRGDAAYNFLDKVINVVYPRVRGFRGVKRNIFDRDGNCSFGFTEHTVFPEVDVEDVRKVHGVQVTVVTSSKDQDHNRALMEALDFPFIKPTEAPAPEAKAEAKPEPKAEKAEAPAEKTEEAPVAAAPADTPAQSEAPTPDTKSDTN